MIRVTEHPGPFGEPSSSLLNGSGEISSALMRLNIPKRVSKPGVSEPGVPLRVMEHPGPFGERSSSLLNGSGEILSALVRLNIPKRVTKPGVPKYLFPTEERVVKRKRVRRTQLELLLDAPHERLMITNTSGDRWLGRLRSRKPICYKV